MNPSYKRRQPFMMIARKQLHIKVKDVFHLTLSHRDQLNLLTDILYDHQTDCCGSVSECEQLERLVKSLLVNPAVGEDMKQMLTDVYSYSQAGKYAQHLDDHIEAHQSKLSEWVDQLNTYF
ncbi:YtzH-like family protein [Weizmannia acidilactici]